MFPRRVPIPSAIFHLPRRPTSSSQGLLRHRPPSVRHQSRSPWPGNGYRQQGQYNRFNRAQTIKHLWQHSTGFRYGVGAAGTGVVGFVGYNIETVPVSGRKRFNWVKSEYEEQMGMEQYKQVKQEFRGRILPEWHPQTRLVQRVLDRLIPSSGLEGQKWEVNVIDDKEQMNAFVIPGGKVFVFSGLLPICNGEDGLATVLGHEIAHNIAHHAAENYSRISLLLPIAYVVSFVWDVSNGLTFTILDYAYNKPGSRKQESEADYIGLMMMAQSCYDPEAAVGLWQRMEKVQQIAIPQFLSTHPSNYNRIGKIQEWLPQAQEKRAQGECGTTVQFVDDFKKAFQSRDNPFA